MVSGMKLIRQPKKPDASGILFCALNLCPKKNYTVTWVVA